MLAIKEYHRPEHIEEALELLNRQEIKSVILAGGTSLLSSKSANFEAVIDLQNLGLDIINNGDTKLDIGAVVRLQEIVEHPSTPELIVKSAIREGPNTFRNMGTIGGVVVVANPNSELYAALLVHDARVTVQYENGTRQIPLAELKGETLAAGLITSISLEKGGAGVAKRVARTPADQAIVAVIGRRKNSGVIKLAFCGMSDRPILAEVGDISSMTPADDFRGTGEYRKQMALILAARVNKNLSES